MNQPRTMTLSGTRIGWAEASRDSDLPPGIIVAATNRQEPEQQERFANALLGQDRQGALIYQIDADERQLREAIELVPAGAEAEFHVTVEDQGRLRLGRIVLTAEAEAQRRPGSGTPLSSPDDHGDRQEPPKLMPR